MSSAKSVSAWNLIVRMPFYSHISVGFVCPSWTCSTADSTRTETPTMESVIGRSGRYSTSPWRSRSRGGEIQFAIKIESFPWRPWPPTTLGDTDTATHMGTGWRVIAAPSQCANIRCDVYHQSCFSFPGGCFQRLPLGPIQALVYFCNSAGISS